MKRISDSTKGKGKDIFRNVYLFTSGQKDIEEDYALILEIIKHYFQIKSVVKIFWNDALIKLKVKEDSLQKAIYRLSLLGIVSDWTTDFVNHFEVNFETVEDSSLIENLTKYISKYEPDTDVEIEISTFEKGSILNNSTWYLLKWIFENISYHRKESLKTLRDWCNDYIYNENFGNEEFKRNIDNYFKFDEITFLLQHISENPQDIEKWFEAFYLLKTDKTIIYIPDLPIEERKREFTNLKVRISRFIESYRNNLGLDFLSGFVRLALDEYEDSNGRIRLESTLEATCQKFSLEKKDAFMNKLMLLGHHLTENQQIELCQSVSKFYPEKLEQFAEYYQLSYLLNDVYSKKLSQLKKLNLKLYEQLATI
jgi:ATP-dependent DNA helicase RecQ